MWKSQIFEWSSTCILCTLFKNNISSFISSGADKYSPGNTQSKSVIHSHITSHYSHTLPRLLWTRCAASPHSARVRLHRLCQLFITASLKNIDRTQIHGMKVNVYIRRRVCRVHERLSTWNSPCPCEFIRSQWLISETAEIPTSRINACTQR